MIWDVIIIGSGPAGLASAVSLKGHKVLLLEKESELANKLRLSGAGQCNMTHEGSLEAFKLKYGKKWRFIQHAMTCYTNDDMIKYFRKHDCNVVVTEAGKVFPESMKSADVIDVLVNDTDANINKDEAVTNIQYDGLYRVTTTKACYQTKNVLVATGGISYPKTGSTGDAVKFANEVGVDSTPYTYALSPIYLNEHVFSDLMGLSFEDVTIDHFRGKKLNSYRGDLLITHFGYSGPMIINASRSFDNGDRLLINFTNFTTKSMEESLLADMVSSPKKAIKTLLSQFVQNRMADKVLSVLCIDPTITASEFNKKDRKRLIKMLTAYEITIDQVGKSHIAMVSKGGILTTELNKKTFESKKFKGLYFVGECVDVDGDTGGYNIQYAFSSGHAASKHIKETLNGKM